jgi:hypothetical protein
VPGPEPGRRRLSLPPVNGVWRGGPSRGVTRDEAWRIAVNITKPPELLGATGKSNAATLLDCAGAFIGDRAIMVSMTMRWMAEITYRNGGAPEIVQFEEIADLHDIVEMGPDWNEIEQIVVTLNLSSATLQTGAINPSRNS